MPDAGAAIGRSGPRCAEPAEPCMLRKERAMTAPLKQTDTRDSSATALFEAQRRRLLRLAYRMLGSFAEAEDIVQDAWLRWRQVDPATVQSPQAFLSQVVTRLCLDHMKSARARRETYVGSWLPEPLIEAEMAPDQDDPSMR